MKNQKQQTEKAFATMMAKTTKTQFAEKWGVEEGVFTVEEIKTATEAVKNAAVGEKKKIEKRFRCGSIEYTFDRDGISLYVSAAFVLDGEKHPLNGRYKYGRMNCTKVSFDYNMLSYLLDKLMERADFIYGKLTVGLTVIAVGDSSVELELHENDEGRTVVAIIQDGNATEKQVKNIVGDLAEFFGCKLNGIEVRKEADNE